MENDIKKSSSSKSQKKRKRKHNKHSSDDDDLVLIDKNKDIPLPIVSKCRELSKKPENNKRRVQLGLDYGGISDLKITQSFKIKQNDNQFVIDIDTNISECGSEVFTLRRNTLNKTPFKCYPPKQRIVPKCVRHECQQWCKHKHTYYSKLEYFSNKKNLRKKEMPKNYFNLNSSSKYRSKRHSNWRNNKCVGISSVLSRPSSDIDSISTDSFESSVDLDKNFNKKPKNKKLVKKVDKKKKCRKSIAKQCEKKKYSKWKPKMHASKSIISSNLLTDMESISTDSFESAVTLDSLIKRAKERDKINFSKKNCSTPVGQSYTPVDQLYSALEDSETSIHTPATMILEPLDTSIYSPTNSCEYFSDIDIFNYCMEFNNNNKKNISEGLTINNDLEFADRNSLVPVTTDTSEPCFTTKTIKIEPTNLEMDPTDDSIINTASIAQIKEEYMDDFYLINDIEADDEYILWNDDGIIDDIKIKEEIL